MSITQAQALDCFRSDDLIGIGMEADAVRRQLHPDGVVTYVLQVGDDVAAEALDRGATEVVLRGGPAAAALDDRLSVLHKRFSMLGLGGLTATDVVRAADGTALRDELAALQAGGLRWLGGWDAQVLDDAYRHGICSVAEWLDVHRTAHSLGIATAATMTFGQGESFEQRVRHLELLGQLQAETGGFCSFTPAGLVHDVAAGGRSLDEATSVEYLKTLAICRMSLDNIANVQAHWPSQGVKVLQMGLRFGANDVGAAGNTAGSSEEDLRRMIRDAGFRPVQRDSVYRVMYLD